MGTVTYTERPMSDSKNPEVNALTRGRAVGATETLLAHCAANEARA
jgi:hypothetical protein